MAVDVVLTAFQDLRESGTEISIQPAKLPVGVIKDIIEAAIARFREMPTLLDLPDPIYIVGDLHGSALDLIRLLRRYDPAKGCRLLFLGDFVDRHAHSLMVILVVLALVIRYPDDVFVIRGNHEWRHINFFYGFRDEVQRLYKSDELWVEFQTVFEWMPLAAVVGSPHRVFCVHGGLSPSLSSLEQVRAIQRPLVSYEGHALVADLVWSDPHDALFGFAPSRRGSGSLFGPRTVERFLSDNGLKLLVRAHQVVADGYSMFARGMGMTVFTCSDYCGGPMRNRGAVLKVDKDGVEAWDLLRDEPVCFRFDTVGVRRVWPARLKTAQVRLMRPLPAMTRGVASKDGPRPTVRVPKVQHIMIGEQSAAHQ